jgi:hypothetical protein
MTDRAAYFVVATVMGRSTPAIYWDELPRAPIPHLEYVTRLDALPNGKAMLAASLAQLFAVYRVLKKRGKLPPRWEPPPKKKDEGTKAAYGHRELFARRYLPDAPAEPWPDPETVGSRRR